VSLSLVRLAVLGVMVVLLAFLPFFISRGNVHVASEVFILLAISQMWNLAAGYAGLMSLGQQAFIGIGAYLLFFLSNTWHVSPYWVLPLVPVFCALVGALCAIVLFRLRDAYFVIGTWVFSEIVAILVAKTSWLGGTSGLSLLTTSLIDLRWFEKVNYWLSAAIALVAVVGSYVLLRSPVGLGLMGVRDNELAATSVGVNVWQSRLLVFVLAAAGCGLAGAISYMGSLYVSTGSAFDIGWVGAMAFIVVVGGMGTLEGPVLGTIIYFMLREGFNAALPASGSWYLVTLGVIAAGTMVVAPQGLWPWIASLIGFEPLSVRRVMPKSGLVALGGQAGPAARSEEYSR
jgi:branched-chain amino acid transport system permease protein